MKLIIAPDKFKGTVSARRVSEIIAAEFRAAIPDIELVQMPLADGGEGTVEALTTALHGEFHKVTVHDPLMRPVEAVFGLAGNTAVIEMASASGMALLKHCELNPMKTTSYGTGELILAAANAGAKEIILGIGGSATIDLGAGMAQAAGIRFYDANGLITAPITGEMLSHIVKIDFSGLHPDVRAMKIRTASDVRSPLAGPKGAAAVFGPQKGATPEMIPVLEHGLISLAGIAGTAPTVPGDGAAGGMGYGLRVFLHSETHSGAGLAMAVCGLREQLTNADFVITGEGCTDEQTEEGKLCSEIASLCKKNKVPCWLLSGSVKAPRNILMKTFDAVFISAIGRNSFDEVVQHAEADLASAAGSMAAIVKAAQKISVSKD